MKAKKFLALFLAVVMAMSLAIPAMAAKKVKGGKDQPAAVPAVTVDKIEHTDKDGNPDPRLPLIENGAAIHTGKYEAIYIKQANDIVIWVKADDTRSEAEIIAQAQASDKSLNKAGKGTTTVIYGEGKVWLHKNKTTLVVVVNGILTVNGPISHIDFVGGDAPTEDELGGDGKVSAAFTITKFLNGMNEFGKGFTFDIRDSEGSVVGSMTSDESGTASATVDVAPGEYTIRETNLNSDKYEAVEDIKVTVTDKGQVIFPEDNGEEVNYIINYELGGLDVNKPTVKQEYDELWHELEYEWTKGDTRVSRVLSDLPDYIKGDTYSNNGHTYLTINAEALENDLDGATIRIAKSDKENTLFPDLAPANPWEDPIPLTYNLKIEAGQLVVTSTLPNFGFAVYGPGEKVEGNKDFKDHGHKHESDAENPAAYTYIKRYDMPELAADGTFRFLIHYDCPGYTTSDITGCNPDSVVTRPCEREIDADDVVVTVKNSSGDEVTKLDKLPHGEYTVIVSVGDEIVDETTVTVNPGKTTEVTFDKPLYMEQGADEYHCSNLNCPALPVEP